MVLIAYACFFSTRRIPRCWKFFVAKASVNWDILSFPKSKNELHRKYVAVGQKYRVPKKPNIGKRKSKPIHPWSPVGFSFWPIAMYEFAPPKKTLCPKTVLCCLFSVFVRSLAFAFLRFLIACFYLCVSFFKRSSVLWKQCHIKKKHFKPPGKNCLTYGMS